MHVIVYNAGSYGQFTGWCIDWMQGNYGYTENTRPFTDMGNSHNNHIKCFPGAEAAIANPISNSHLHPVRNQSDNAITEIETCLTVFDKVILLYPWLDDFLWNCNNKLYKVDGLVGYLERLMINLDFSAWEDQSRWELREWFSIWLYDQHMAESGYKDIVDYTNDRVFKVPINKIRDDFSNTYQSMAKFLDINVIRTAEDFDNLHKDWLANEKHLYKDRLIKELVHATIHNISIEMKDLTLFDEAEMQRRLRLEGYEIKCYGLNEWPKTTTQLRELIYEADVQMASI